jgi:hypothetical protein
LVQQSLSGPAGLRRLAAAITILLIELRRDDTVCHLRGNR